MMLLCRCGVTFIDIEEKIMTLVKFGPIYIAFSKQPFSANIINYRRKTSAWQVKGTPSNHKIIKP